jgi:ABC-type Fe3+-citrate transport system substrate-binding protein
MQTVRIHDLLKRTVFYKVGHHGSHNATLRAQGLEQMEHPDLVAMIPVHRKTAEDQKWKFPYPPLWKALKERARGRVLLADSPDIQEIQDDAEKMLTDEEWEKFTKATDFQDLYVEYRIPY